MITLKYKITSGALLPNKYPKGTPEYMLVNRVNDLTNMVFELQQELENIDRNQPMYFD